ncbi:MAG: hypothetical protein V1870_02640 [Candidatus Aenigmatarchaeota archaeon]
MNKPYELSEEEMQYVITDSILKYSGLDIPNRRLAMDNDIVHAAQKKMLEYLDKPCGCNSPYIVGTRWCQRHWEKLCKEFNIEV